MAYIGREPQIGNFQVCDAISTVNNQAAYTMQVGGVNVSPETANHMLVSLNGILQAPGSSYTVSGSTITFAANLVTGDVINFIQILGSVLDLGVPSDATVSTAKIVDNAVTLAKMASGTDGNIISYDTSGNPVAVATGNDGQVLTSAGAGAVPTFETLPAGGGKVLQVISATDSTTRATTSTSYVTGSNSMTVTITPATTSSKIFIIATFGAHKNSGISAYTVFRGGSAISGAPAVMALLKMTNDNPQNGAFNFLDSPSSTSELVYQFMFRTVEGSNESSINPSNGAQSTGNFTVMEIGG